MNFFIFIISFSLAVSCKHNAFQAPEEVLAGQKEEKEISELILDKNYEHAYKRLQERLKKLEGLAKERLKTLLGSVILKGMGIDEKAIIGAIDKKGSKEQLKAFMKNTPDPTPENRAKMKEAIKELEEGSDNKINEMNLNVARASYVSSLLKETRGSDGESFEREEAEKNITVEESKEIIDNLQKINEASKKAGNKGFNPEKTAELSTGTPDEQRRKLFNFLQDIDEGH
jgi:hypothetical protein